MNSVGGKNSAMSKKGGGFSMGGYSKGGSHNDNYRKDSSSRDRSNSSSRNSSGGVRSVKGASMLSSLPKKNSASSMMRWDTQTAPRRWRRPLR